MSIHTLRMKHACLVDVYILKIIMIKWYGITDCPSLLTWQKNRNSHFKYISMLHIPRFTQKPQKYHRSFVTSPSTSGHWVYFRDAAARAWGLLNPETKVNVFSVPWVPPPACCTKGWRPNRSGAGWRWRSPQRAERSSKGWKRPWNHLNHRNVTFR